MSQQRIAVIGAGVVGLAVARELALQNAEVTLFEREAIGAGTSSRTYAWVNSNGKQPASYHQLNVLSMALHHELQASQPQGLRWLECCGTVEWASPGIELQRLQQRVEKLQQQGYGVETLSREALIARLPDLRHSELPQTVWHFPEEGLIYPALFMAKLWSDARRHGAHLHIQSEVTAIEDHGQGVALHLADGTVWHGDQLVIAAGRWSPQLTAMLGVELAMIDANKPNKIACSFLATTAPLAVQLSANVISPQLNIRPDGGGRLLLQANDLDDQADPQQPTTCDGIIAQQFLSRLQTLLVNSERAQLEKVVIGQRSRPADGLPGVGYLNGHQRVYVVVTHSGITLAPLLGRLAASEILHGRAEPLLTDFRLPRLLNKSAADFPAFSTVHFPAAQ